MNTASHVSSELWVDFVCVLTSKHCSETRAGQVKKSCFPLLILAPGVEQLLLPGAWLSLQPGPSPAQQDLLWPHSCTAPSLQHNPHQAGAWAQKLLPGGFLFPLQAAPWDLLVGFRWVLLDTHVGSGAGFVAYLLSCLATGLHALGHSRGMSPLAAAPPLLSKVAVDLQKVAEFGPVAWRQPKLGLNTRQQSLQGHVLSAAGINCSPGATLLPGL